MTSETLKDALIDELKDILHAEKQITKALPKMAKNAEDASLAEAFKAHLQETEGQIERLTKALELLDAPVKAIPCAGMKGIIEEGSEHLEEYDAGPMRDAVLIGDAQKVEHYEIASYGTAIAWAESLGQDEIVQLLEESLEEEKAADKKLTKIAATLNLEAAEEVEVA